MTVEELIEELEKLNPEDEIEVMFDFHTREILGVTQDDEDGLYIEVAEG